MNNLLCVAYVACQRGAKISEPSKIWSHIPAVQQIIQLPPRENQVHELNDTPKPHQEGGQTEDRKGAQ